MYQARVIASFSQDGLDPVFLAKGLVATNELDFDACFEGQLFGMCA